MPNIIRLAFLVSFLFQMPAFAGHVNGYVRSNGTYVQGYERSDPNSTVRDNYDYKGNTNPYTGATGDNYYRHSPSSEYYETSGAKSGQYDTYKSNQGQYGN